jgi:hypothetical protein
LSYTLLQAHNVYQHIYAVQEGNRRYAQGIKPKMVLDKFDHSTFGDIVDEIFSLKDRQKSLDLIEKYSSFWTQMKAGQGFSGKKTVNAHSQFAALFTVENTEPEVDEEIEDSDDAINEALTE